MSTTVTLAGNPVNVGGDLPRPGDKAPGFMLVDKELKDVPLSSYGGKRKILNIVPSLDTAVCAASARRFNAEAGSLPNTVVLVISADLPFAQARYCGAEGLDNVVTLSTLRGREFMVAYGVEIMDPPLSGLTARAVVVLDENDTVVYSQMVPEITQEPDYDAALAAARG